MFRSGNHLQRTPALRNRGEHHRRFDPDKAHRMRRTPSVTLDATAYAALLAFFGRRASTSLSQGSITRPTRLCVSMTLRAPWISKVLRYGSPRLLMPSNFTRPPVPDCRGTKPRKAANSRPERKVHRRPSRPPPSPSADQRQESRRAACTRLRDAASRRSDARALRCGPSSFSAPQVDPTTPHGPTPAPDRWSGPPAPG